MNDLFLLCLIGLIFLIYFFLMLFLKPNKSIFNFKSDVNKAEQTKIKQPKFTGDKTLIGTNNKKEIFIPNNAKHIFVCGTTGSGKTVALANFIKSGIDYNYPLLIVDGKGDTNENSIIDIIRKLSPTQKVYTINLNDPKNSMKYNPFKNTLPTVIKDMLINLSVWSEEHYKLNTERYLQRLIDLLVKAEIQTSFKNIIMHIEISKFTALSSTLVKSNLITKEEHLNNIELSKACEQIIAGATARFTSLYESEIGTIFDDDGIDIYTALKEKAIILFILNPLLYSETSPLFGNLVIIDSKKAVSNLFDDNYQRTFFIFDEINVYASTSFLNLINKSRSANITCVLATQSLSDLDASVDEYFKEQVIENCNNYILLRQNSPANAEKWAEIIGTRSTIKTTYQIDDSGNSDKGSIRATREFIYAPDYIKRLKTGKALYISKDNDYHSKIDVHKCF